jgi:hypothetical protein
MPYKKSPDMSSARIKVPSSHLDWLMLELNTPSHADLLAGLVHYATTPAGKAAVRASGLVLQRKVPTPPSSVVPVLPDAPKKTTREDIDDLLADI